jgi:hypothetical protein
LNYVNFRLVNQVANARLCRFPNFICAYLTLCAAVWIHPNNLSHLELEFVLFTLVGQCDVTPRDLIVEIRELVEHLFRELAPKNLEHCG